MRRVCQYPNCRKPAIDSERESCIFHEAIGEKNIEAFKRRIGRKIRKNDYNFAGYVFGDFQFEGVTFETKADFSDTRFEGHLSFPGVTFRREALFGGAIFQNGVRFGLIQKSADGQLQETNAIFEGPAHFERATFWMSTTIRATFKKGAFFRGAHFGGPSDFRQAVFVGNTDTGFDDTTFRHVQFDKATFVGSVSFRKARFHESASFSETNWGPMEPGGFALVDFGKAIFFSFCDFGKAIFEKDVHANFSEVTFWNAKFKETTFSRFSLYPASVRDIIDFTGAKFADPFDEEIAFRMSKISYRENGQYDRAGECYFRERVARWKHLRWWPAGPVHIRLFSFWRKAFDWVYFSTCGYGERPWRVITWAFGIFIVLACLYYCIGHIASVIPGQTFDLGNAIYFSGTTFVTLGFGGPWYPCPNHWIKFFVMGEAALGSFFLALFVMTFGRRMMR